MEIGHAGKASRGNRWQEGGCTLYGARHWSQLFGNYDNPAAPWASSDIIVIIIIIIIIIITLVIHILKFSAFE